MLGKVEFTNKIVSKNLGREEKEVASVMNFFFKELSLEFKECKNPYVYVKDLGTFGVNANSVGKRLKTLLNKRRWYLQNTSMSETGFELPIKYITAEIFELFRVRRMVKTRNKENQKLRREGKIKNDIERKLVQTAGEE